MSYREGKVRRLQFEKGQLKADTTEASSDENGTYIHFEPDATLFKNYRFHDDIVETMLRNYTYLNSGLTIMYNGRRIRSRNGLEDLLSDNMTNDGLYPIVHMQEEPTKVHSRSTSPRPSRSSTANTSMATSATGWWRPSPSTWRSLFSSRRRR